ncbi:MAG: LysM peptidoglycan-binding domain-containing protein [Tannerellaceae bacterium]|nr:LysM peptidoglycan-binding domain-containing protein [Tannerellaceae bacterium]MCD8263099.1 LysM peptidoglycan-binding domain-containing protein [Tannerellaceae bacterium]
MNKISVYILIFILNLTCFPAYSQNYNVRVISNNEQDSDIFYHTIERGQTAYAIATMYGVSVDDIYRLNPESREGIRAGDRLRIPQRDAAVAPIDMKGEEYIYHTIQPRETLYALTIRYNVTAESILSTNPGLSTSTFTIGKTIRIPATPLEILPTTEVKPVTKELEYVVEKKETIYRISRKFNVSSAELIRYNPELRNGLKAGMVLKIPVQTEETMTSTPVQPRESDVNALLAARKGVERVNMLKVAVLLPFNTNEPTPSQTTSRFIEYYEGLLLAVDSLKTMGCSVELSVFDTGNDVSRINQILRQEVLKEANLIIGGVQNEQITPIAEFAQEHNIRYVIPFTSRNDDVLSNAMVFQVNTPHSYLYDKASQAGCDLFGKDNIILLSVPETEEKSEFITAFKAEMIQRNIPYHELVFQAETFSTDMEKLLSGEQRNVVVPTSGTLEALNALKSPLRVIAETEPQYNLTLFGYPEWQTYVRDALEDFYALNTYIYTNFYADNLSPEVNDFYVKFKTWYSKTPANTYPKYGILGFDTGMFFLNAMYRYGTNFEDNLTQVRYKSIQTGFDFQRVNNWGGFINTNIFIVHYSQGGFNVTRTEVR